MVEKWWELPPDSDENGIIRIPAGYYKSITGEFKRYGPYSGRTSACSPDAADEFHKMPDIPVMRHP